MYIFISKLFLIGSENPETITPSPSPAPSPEKVQDEPHTEL